MSASKSRFLGTLKSGRFAVAAVFVMALALVLVTIIPQNAEAVVTASDVDSGSNLSLLNPYGSYGPQYLNGHWWAFYATTAGNGGILYKTSDDGATWSNATTLFTWSSWEGAFAVTNDGSAFHFAYCKIISNLHWLCYSRGTVSTPLGASPSITLGAQQNITLAPYLSQTSICNGIDNYIYIGYNRDYSNEKSTDTIYLTKNDFPSSSSIWLNENGFPLLVSESSPIIPYSFAVRLIPTNLGVYVFTACANTQNVNYNLCARGNLSMGGITRATVENPSTSAAGVGWSVMVGRDDVIHLTWWNGTASRYRAVQSGVWGDETTISTSNIMNGQIGRLDMAYQTMIFYVSGASIKAYDLSNLGDSPLTIYTDTATIDGISPVVGMYASGTTKILYHTTASKLRFVDVVVAPTAAFTWTPTTVYSQFTAVAFNSTGSFNGGDAGLSYAWDFESDGTIDSTIAMPFHVYYYAGTYNVTLHVYNSVDDDVAVHSITVIADTGGTPFAGFDPTANESLAIVILVSGALFLFVLAMMYRRR